MGCKDVSVLLPLTIDPASADNDLDMTVQPGDVLAALAGVSEVGTATREAGK